MPGARTPSTTYLGRAAVAALKAWADLDRFELSEVPVNLEDGYAAAGTIERDRAPHPWPPRPEKTPDDATKVLTTRVMFGCLEVRDLEDLLDRLFSDDLRFVQTGVRRPGRRRSSAPRRDQPQTCRGSFRLDAAGALVAGSLEYAPLVDFARNVEHLRGKSVPVDAAVGRALQAIEEREQALLDAFAEVVESGAEGTDALGRVLGRLRVHGDRTRYHTTWVGPADEPTGPLPAFFRNDLLQATHLRPSPPLEQYLAGRPEARPAAAQDLEERRHLEPHLDPRRLPRAAWPTGHVLRLSQQVALTAVLAADADPLMAVNGPPGTGKTTLLRDLYANLVTRRASVMVRFDDPVTSWGPRQDPDSVNQQRWHLWAPHPDLCGFEMVLASSNNAAAENVSKELPESGAVKGDVGRRLTYFTTAANDEPYAPTVVPRLRGRRRPGLLTEGRSAWGFAAVALGSRDRVGRFEEVVGRYQSSHTVSALLRTLAAPTPPLTDWQQARAHFRRCEQAVEVAVGAVVTRVAEDAELRALRGRLAYARARAEQSWATRQAAQADVAVARAEVTRFAGAAQATRSRVDEHAQRRPGWWSRLGGRASLDEWRTSATALADAARDAAADHEARVAVLRSREQEASAADQRWQADDRAWRSDVDRAAALERRVGTAPASGTWVTEDWWGRRRDDSGPGSGREAVELGAAWVDPGLQRLREELFEAALRVHESFARRSREQVTANLRTWLALQSNEVQGQSAEEVTLGAWQSVFLVVPLVSTTFASVARLMRRVPYGGLGWLVVDEAGQAVPGAAVGALARCRRAVVVGDPLQLEPVVTLPRTLVSQLHDHHRAPADLAPTRASVQTLADSVSRYGTVRLGRWISIPLVVHNRCLDPMFSVANVMAYAGRMVRGRLPAPTEATSPAPSRWIDVVRPAADTDHFHLGDWDALDALLRTFDWEADPSLAIISPFKKVTRELAPRVRAAVEERLLERQVPPAGKRLKELVDGVRVGTVHTFQGREYATVVLVLGGATPGARGWAAATPNLLNVAVTRARDRLYVIGDRAAWRTTGYAATLHDGFPGPDEPPAAEPLAAG